MSEDYDTDEVSRPHHVRRQSERSGSGLTRILYRHGDSMLKAMGGLVLAIAMFIAAFAWNEVYKLRIEHEAVKTRQTEGERRYDSLEGRLDKMDAKLDRLLERKP